MLESAHILISTPIKCWKLYYILPRGQLIHDISICYEVSLSMAIVYKDYAAQSGKLSCQQQLNENDYV